MANQELVDLLKQGVGAWNQWGLANQSITPDLSGASLSKANFREADLSDANLSEADLSKADFSYALQPHFFLMEIASTHYMARSRKRAS